MDNALWSRIRPSMTVAAMHLPPTINPSGFWTLSPAHVPRCPAADWTPPNQSDWRRYVEQAIYACPYFFQNDGTIGLPLAGRYPDRGHCCAAGTARPSRRGSLYPNPHCLAWVRTWERQIQIRDQTRQRNEITLERFVKLVAGVVDRFLTAAASTPPQMCLEGWTGGDH
ncbi:hypothetical protein BJV77DRAFT_223041 [Russula vinacea]|nr:hypothetical protein BJV77DRAFT_223041 [Russula vinacea]